MKDLVIKPQLKFLGDAFQLLANALIVNGKPAAEEYDEAFRRLSTVESATSWWWGDLANARERDYGSLKELAEKSGINYNSLHDYQAVARAYKLDMRMSSLSFYHHQIVAPLENRLEWLKRAEANNWSARELRMAIIRFKWQQSRKALPTMPIIAKANCLDWLEKQPRCDLLITDPPYMTEIDDIDKFASDWLPIALAKVKPTGRAYIFVGAYPQELSAYLNVQIKHMLLPNILVWTYRNTLGQPPKLDYNLNWQGILYYRGLEAEALNCPLLIEQFAVQDINAPDGRDENHYRYHTWQKPDELAERFIAHSSKVGNLVFDCFAGTGTFLLAAAKLGRIARGCDISDEMIDIALERGCQLE